MRRLTLQILTSSLLSTLVFPAGAQDIEIKGAQIILQPKTVSVERITIENRRHSPLMAWEIGLYDRKANLLGMTSNADFSWQVNLASFD